MQQNGPSTDADGSGARRSYAQQRRTRTLLPRHSTRHPSRKMSSESLEFQGACLHPHVLIKSLTFPFRSDQESLTVASSCPRHREPLQGPVTQGIPAAETPHTTLPGLLSPAWSALPQLCWPGPRGRDTPSPHFPKPRPRGLWGSHGAHLPSPCIPWLPGEKSNFHLLLTPVWTWACGLVGTHWPEDTAGQKDPLGAHALLRQAEWERETPFPQSP